MLKHASITRDRARQFLDRELVKSIVGERTALDAEFSDGGAWKAIKPGFKWGPAYAQARYRTKVAVPESMAGKPVALTYWTPEVWGQKEGSVEATVWCEGSVVGGLDYAHLFHRVTDRAEPGQEFTFELQTYARNAQTTVHGAEMPREPKPEVFHGLWLVAINQEVMDLAFDFSFCLNLLDGLGADDPCRETVLRALNDVCNGYRPESKRALTACRARLRTALDSLHGECPHTLTAVGHAHLDTAWLWPLSVTHLKMAHTTALQLGMMERYPEYVYVHSQASQYEWLEQEHPQLFERVRKAARKGQWEPLGSMWVEADCNLTGAESLVRQFLYGKAYFREKFGVDTVDMWLPDVFGYSAALPQILTKFGIKAFLTQKLSWNQFNKLPHHTFWWQGIDGSKVWTHFPPADTYIGSCEPKEIIESVKKYKDHGRCDRSLYLFGFGDGGGGPTERHLEYLRRARTAPMLPSIESRTKAADFFQNAIEESDDVCTWAGELYFELHRGTYTSQAANKRANRECEFLLRDVELLQAFMPDPLQSRLEELWKLVLLNQFHDIIPGSSVREVYEDSNNDYSVVRTESAKLIDKALEHFAASIRTVDMKRPLALFQNSVVPSEASVPWNGQEPPTVLHAGEERLPVQLVDDTWGQRLIFQTPESALGAVCVADLTSGRPSVAPRLKSTNRRLESEDLSVRFDANGNITSIQTLDDDPVELIAPGELANVFMLFDDRPLFWDAWDVDIYAYETGRKIVRSESVEVVEKGPVRAAIEVVRSFGKSRIRQRISLGPTPGVRFDTWIDWHEDEKMLKVAFPLNVNTPKATFEIQFGNVERPTHKNTSWDLARFEVCAQKWVDMSEGGYGAALINDGKYGHDVDGNVLRLTLLRSPKAPDPLCDMGEHRFTYVLLPHYDQVQHSDVVASAYAINAPCRHRFVKPKPGKLSALPRFVDCDNRNLVVEALKRSEDGRRTVVRAYECHNTRGRATLRLAAPVKRAWSAMLDESPVAELEVVDGAVQIPFKPFEILTVLAET